MFNKKQGGFTLIELLIVIAIIAIIASVMFVALDPLTRFRDARDSARWSDISAIVSAVKIDQVDNGGNYIDAIATSTVVADTIYMIGTDTSGCDDATCDDAILADGNCIDLSGLVTEGYLGAVPVSPDGAGTWTAGITGYTLTKNANGTIRVSACESENSDAIFIVR